MRSWTRPAVPAVAGNGPVIRLSDTATATAEPIECQPDAAASIYVCGITPYDATHIGHAATYIAFDTLIRAWLDQGLDVDYAQNSTDVDDPLLERAVATGVDWRELAATQLDLYRSDMESLRVIPPDHFIAVTDEIDSISAAVESLVTAEVGYRIDDDVYFDVAKATAASQWHLGAESHLDRAEMLRLSAARGGDPDRDGKRDALDPQLWRAADGIDPAWESPLGAGRPGWHIECSVIASKYLGDRVTVVGGGRDLVFPHHEFSAAHTAVLDGLPLASVHVHAGLVAFEGEKMSKSLGNLVFVSELLRNGVDPRAIRLAILAQHYRVDWEWTADVLAEGTARLARWTDWASATNSAADAAAASLAHDRLRAAIANDLDTPAALTAIDGLVAAGGRAEPETIDLIDALLGVRLK